MLASPCLACCRGSGRVCTVQMAECVVLLCALSFKDENLPVLRNEDIGSLVSSVIQRFPDNTDIEEFGPRLISNL